MLEKTACAFERRGRSFFRAVFLPLLPLFHLAHDDELVHQENDHPADERAEELTDRVAPIRADMRSDRVSERARHPGREENERDHGDDIDDNAENHVVVGVEGLFAVDGEGYYLGDAL